MVERLPWIILGASHLARSFFEDLGQKELRAELSHLRVEIHRTKELIQDYRTVLDSCEKDLDWAKRSGHFFSSTNIVLGLVLLILLLVWRYQPSKAVQQSELPLADCDTLASGTALVRRKGPRRPSDLGEKVL